MELHWSLLFKTLTNRSKFVIVDLMAILMKKRGIYE